MAIDRKIFFDLVRVSGVAGKPLKQRTVDSLNTILDAWQTHFLASDLRERAYTMATARHEAWDLRERQIDYAIKEIGGESKDYGQPHPVTGKRYYGRGLTQITHYDNYRRAGAYLDVDLVNDPDLALRADISAAILVCGVVLGWFREGSRGSRIGFYFNDKVDDPVQARGIINGDVEKYGHLIAGYYKLFLEALRAAEPAEAVFVA